MGKITVGKPVPDFEARGAENSRFRRSDLEGRFVILYFYPKDNTPGCTTEAQDFRDQFENFRKLGADVIGVSRDSLKSHEGFREKYCLPFDLISDDDEKICKLFGVMKEKNMYGRKVMGIERSTFIIDPKGILRREYRGVKVDGHVRDLLADLRAIKKEKH